METPKIVEKPKFQQPVILEKSEWTGVKTNIAVSDGQSIKASNKYIALSWDAGIFIKIINQGNTGALCIIDQEQKGKLPENYPLLKAHSEPIQDFDFLPFNDNYIATSSGDSTIQIWNIPEDLNNLATATPLNILYGHTKKINLIQFNPTSEGILASSSYDSTIKIWDVAEGQLKSSVSSQEYPYTISWNENGSLLGSIWRDKFLRLLDPRNNKFVVETAAHEGGKNQKLCFMGNNLDNIVTVGFSKTMSREYKVWDIKQMERPLLQQQIDTSSSVTMPYFDSDLNQLWLSGKGDYYLKYYEWINGNFVCYQNDYKTQVQAKGCCFVPKTSLNVKKTEVNRCYLLSEKGINSISIQTSRKGDIFQDEFYPDCAYDIGQNSDSWLSGNNAFCKKRSMRPESEKPVAIAYRQIQFTLMDMFDHNSGNSFQQQKAPTNTIVKKEEQVKKVDTQLLDELRKKLKEKEEFIQQLKRENQDQHEKILQKQSNNEENDLNWLKNDENLKEIFALAENIKQQLQEKEEVDYVLQQHKGEWEGDLDVQNRINKFENAVKNMLVDIANFKESL